MHADHHTGLLSLLWYRARAAGGRHDLPPLPVSGPPALGPLVESYNALIVAAMVADGAPAPVPPPARFLPPTLFPAAIVHGSAAAPTAVEAFTQCAVNHSCRDAYGCGIVLRHTGTSSRIVVAYSGDTRPCPSFEATMTALTRAAVAATASGYYGHVAAAAAAAVAVAPRVAALLIHEATFDDDRAADAVAKMHATVGEAVACGARMAAALPSGATWLGTLLTHFSQRYPALPAPPPTAAAAATVVDAAAVPVAPSGSLAVLAGLDGLTLPLAPPSACAAALASGAAGYAAACAAAAE